LYLEGVRGTVPAKLGVLGQYRGKGEKLVMLGQYKG
jgi:hypothetical protein